MKELNDISVEKSVSNLKRCLPWVQQICEIRKKFRLPAPKAEIIEQYLQQGSRILDQEIYDVAIIHKENFAKDHPFLGGEIQMPEIKQEHEQLNSTQRVFSNFIGEINGDAACPYFSVSLYDFNSDGIPIISQRSLNEINKKIKRPNSPEAKEITAIGKDLINAFLKAKTWLESHGYKYTAEQVFKSWIWQSDGDIYISPRLYQLIDKHSDNGS